jgi:hypothetical protein
MASLNHSEYLLLKSPGWTRYVAGHFLLVFELRQCYICSTVDISIIFWFGTRGDNDWDKFTYNRNPDGFCKNSWPQIFNILYLVQYLLMNKNENKYEPSKQPSENYYSGETIGRLHTEVI